MRIPMLLAAAPTLLVACAHGSGPARFAGDREDPRTPPRWIAEIDAAPEGYEILGRVVSSCEDVLRVRAFDDWWLGDVACSDALLVASLREKAAEVGGDLLVARGCSEDPIGDQALRRTCHAGVGRAVEGRPKTLPRRARRVSHGDVGDAPWLGAPGQAWRVVVAFTPDRVRPARAARHPTEVRETPYLPASDVPLGDVRARCEGRCVLAVVREAVRAGAARVGADSVSEVACARGPEGLVCTGHAGTYEVDPRAVTAAR